MTLTRARLLDVFGRTLEVPVDAVVTPTRSSVEDQVGALAIAPRLLRPARWQFRLVDAATAVGSEGDAARVDQIDPTLQVNPVAGFVMPDHLDESLELFDVNGAPIGELLHEAVSGGVMWEIAAGREGPADAGPLYGLAPSQLALGRFAAGLVAADARAREGAPLDPDAPRESALSALLRAIDTTLLEHRHLCRTRQRARRGAGGAAGRDGARAAAAGAAAAARTSTCRTRRAPPNGRRQRSSASQYAFPVRLGEVTRSDDGVLGFFVDDDFSQFRLVDKAIAGMARNCGSQPRAVRPVSARE